MACGSFIGPINPALSRPRKGEALEHDGELHGKRDSGHYNLDPAPLAEHSDEAK
jgi:hypothetical protein